MNIVNSIFNLGENETNLYIFHPDFVKKNKNKCKIIFNNKKYPLACQYEITNNKIKKVKIKFKSYQYLDSTKIRCTINPNNNNSNQINIFGYNFVKNNRDK